MPAMPVTITGVLFDKHARTTQLVTLMGEMSRSDLGVGGGPIIPPPSPGVPTHPIALPGDPWWGGDLKPTHPIVIPDPKPPQLPGGEVLQPGEILAIQKQPDGSLSWVKFVPAPEVPRPPPVVGPKR